MLDAKKLEDCTRVRILSNSRLNFQGRPTVLPGLIYAITTDGRLAQLSSHGIAFPAEAAGQDKLRFQGDIAVFQIVNGRSIYAITTDGRLAQMWDGDRWTLDFPAEAAGQGRLRFQGGIAVIPTDSYANKKSICAITTDGRLAQVWDGDRWALDFPAEAAGQGRLRFQGGVEAFSTDPNANKKSIHAITTDGRLAQVWDGDRWALDFPAEAAGQGRLRFQGGVAVFPTDASDNKKSIYAITTDGRLAQMWDGDRWALDFPAEAAGQGRLRFQGRVAVFRTDFEANKKSIYAITTDGRLAQMWDGDRWTLDFPAEAAGQGRLRFQGGIAVIPTDALANKKSIYAITTDGRLARVWDGDRWRLSFPAELTNTMMSDEGNGLDNAS